MAASTPFGRKCKSGRRKNIERRTKVDEMTDERGVRHPESAFRRERVMAPKAGSVPGTKDTAMLAAPKATSSLLRLMGYPNRVLFCLAATMESRNPAMEIKLESTS